MLSCKNKRLLKKDEKELNHRMLLNLGHTFAHAIEKELDYKDKTWRSCICWTFDGNEIICFIK